MSDLKFIAQVTLSTSASSISFTSIPQTYKHLVLKVSCRTNVAGAVDGLQLHLNGGIVSFASRLLTTQGTPGSAGPGNYNNVTIPGDGTGTNNFGTGTIYIPAYSVTTIRKNYTSFTGSPANNSSGTARFNTMGSGMLSVNDAVTSITITSFDSGGSAFLTKSNVTLYGI